MYHATLRIFDRFADETALRLLSESRGVLSVDGAHTEARRLIRALERITAAEWKGTPHESATPLLEKHSLEALRRLEALYRARLANIHRGSGDEAIETYNRTRKRYGGTVFTVWQRYHESGSLPTETDRMLMDSRR